MKTPFTIILFFLISICGYSQAAYTYDAGKITQNEMSMTEFDKDKDAEAVVLYNFGDYYFQGEESRGFILHMKRRTKIKILKQAGVKYADFEIPYYIGDSGWETIDNIEGITYNWENGQLTKTILENKAIFEEKVNDNVRVKKIALSNVREGSIIELSYTISTPYFFNMRKWMFQEKIPVIYSKLTYKAIPYYEYTYIMKGASKLDESKSEILSDDIRFGQLLYREVKFDFGMKNIPAFKDEEFITSEQDYMISLNFQLSKLIYPGGGGREIMTTWPAMSEDFLKSDDFGKYIRNSEKEAKKILPTLNLTNKDAKDQVETITQYVKSKYNWNGIYGKYANVSLSEFMKQQTGNVGNINLFLIGLLNAAKIEAYPVVLSTRKNGAISKGHPFQQFFNYVIALVKIEDNTYFIDATEPLLYYSNLPERCMNVEGLVVKPKVEEWTIVRQRNISVTQKDLHLKLLPEENKIEVNAQFIGSGLSAYNFRTIHVGKDENLSKYLKDKNNIEVKNDLKIGEVDKLNRPFSFTFSFDTSLENTSDKLFVSPFCNLSISDNPFKQTSRSTLIDLVYIRGDIYKSTIDIPDGYEVEYSPESYISEDELVKINYSLVKDKSRISIDASYYLKKSVYNPDDYIKLKMSFADIIKRFSEMIVLVKKKTES
ncbi:DUF3857 domain-containing protein [Dysgonomonas sp. Marseille-P4677]|uniref:DUF3857 domain-containing protein n=1 Tax=Dysgonomonas sp. Marseille-P4677 TaxID=2364790 RepID=UPI001912F18C|nr:DUF3857 domain-containing protein [Dysgonomonas sp. Marseille-P4677]MBK5722149.1 DUF3857 domain-containing protein [Dysgonomonas sp. Marseille-P4677]